MYTFTEREVLPRGVGLDAATLQGCMRSERGVQDTRAHGSAALEAQPSGAPLGSGSDYCCIPGRRCGASLFGCGRRMIV